MRPLGTAAELERRRRLALSHLHNGHSVSDIAEFLMLESPTVPSRRRRGKAEVEGMKPEEIERLVIELEEEMYTAAEELRFEYAAKLRDEIKELRRELLAVTA